jgi:LysM repeat protein
MVNESDALRAGPTAQPMPDAWIQRPRGIRAALGLPLAIVSTIAVTLGIVQPAEAAPQSVKRQAKAKDHSSNPVRTAHTATTTAAAAPSEYVVADGDTVSGVAERFGLATAEVLALNGLSWSSLIFPGQRLALPGGTPAGAAASHEPAVPSDITKHVVAEGETVSDIAAAYGLDVASVLSANGLGPSSLIFPGEAIVLPPAGSAAVAPAVAAAVPEPEPQPGPPAESHVVVDGDTLHDIAGAYGVTVADLDAANGLGGSTVIVPGQVLVIRRTIPVTVASVNVALTDEMRANARIIVDVGRALGVPDQAIVIALVAAAQESALRNVHHGDLDSLGLFQQRPSEGWGTVEEVLDPVRAATAFYGGAANPNPGRTRGVLDIPGWESMTVTQAAQAVQLSAYPDHYAKWEVSARAWLSELG